MMNHKKHIEWFHELGTNRAGLTYELVKAFADSEEEDLNSSLILSFEHIERVLMFKNILQYDENDLEEFWFYLDATVEQTSYYACMALPLIRQLIESKEIKIENGLYCPDVQDSNVELINLCQTEEEKKKIVYAYKLATIVRNLSVRYISLTSSEGLANWAKEFSICCAYFIMFDLTPEIS